MRKISLVLRIAALVSVLMIMVLMQPGCAKRMAILYLDDTFHNFAGEALDRLHFAYTRVVTGSDFTDAIHSQAWDLVIVDCFEAVFPSDHAYGYMQDFVEKGGRLIITTQHLNTHASFWAVLGYEYSESVNEPIVVWPIGSADDLWSKPCDMPSSIPFNQADDPTLRVTNAFKGDAVAGGTVRGAFTSANPPGAGEGAIFVANSGRTIVNAFYLDDADNLNVPLDFDHDGTPDAVECYMNEIIYVRDAGGEFGASGIVAKARLA